MRRALLAVVVAIVGCDGSLSTSGRDAGTRPPNDALSPLGTDAPAPLGVDAYSPPGFDAYTPAGACASVSCEANERCEEPSGTCVCLPGFVDGASGCVAATPGDPSARTTAEMCAIWAEAHRTTATTSWNEGSSMCEGGSMPRAAIDDTLRRITGFRAMVGLGPVLDIPEQAAQQQSCAVMMYRNGSLSHSPPESWRCYTAAGAAGAGSSNLALGTSNSADTIDLYVDDRGVDSLGHRRWVLNGPLGRVGIGFAGNAGCLSVFDTSASTTRTWIAWPPPGPAPRETTSAWWSFQSVRGSVASAEVRMVRVRDGVDVTGTVHRLTDGYGGSSVAWSPTERTLGERYRVTVTSGALGEITYEVEIVDCS